MDFNTAQSMFRDDKIRALASSDDGLRFLKLRSLSRKEHLERVFSELAVQPEASGVKAMFREVYDNQTLTNEEIDRIIDSIYEDERRLRRDKEDELVSQLYRLSVFDWGGLHQNSLEKTIVDNYVKKITSYELLNSKIENELHNSLRGYVLCSWYNHWTSIMIEDVFKDHERVLPAVGLVKKIDFFVNNIPFDLKVTYLPEGFIKEARRATKLRPELTLLKQEARRHNIHFNTSMPEGALLADLWAKHNDHPSTGSRKLICELAAFRQKLIADCLEDSTTLIRWLYENQGVRRFDASNRLFLVLIDESSFFDSWKLKRAKPLLEKQVHEYLDNTGDLIGKEIDFDWEGTTYEVTSDVVFVVHKSATS